MELMLLRKRNNQIKIYLTDSELNSLKLNVQRSKLKQSDFIRKSILNQNITVIEGIKDYLIEFKKIGNNINQITKAIHQGETNCQNELIEVKKELKKLWQLLKLVKVENQ